MKLRMNWRLASRLSVVTCVVLVIIVVLIIQQQRSAASGNNNALPAGLEGTDLGNPPVTAPNFQLMDQAGKQISLVQFKGKPVVLAFMYTHCPDICPVTAEHIHSALLQMGGDAKSVGILAVSTDPKGDTPAAASKFTQQHNMQDYWHFLIGTKAQLSPVWNNYNVNAQQQMAMVSHSYAVYVIDKQGNERAFIDYNFTPAKLASYLQTLLHA